MKNKGLIITLSVIGMLIVPVLILMLSGNHRATAADDGDLSYNIVELVEKSSSTSESTYRVGTNLPATGFSSIGKTLSKKIEQEWKAYDGLTEMQRYFSSHIWGLCGFQIDTWDECEKAIGFTVNNPLESLDWLNKTGYIGMESANPNSPIKHIEVDAHTAQSDRKLRYLTITAGYNVENIRIMLRATLSSDDDMYTIGGITNGYATYEESTTTTGSGIPVLIVTTNETNNNGYYHGNYFDPTAYWSKGNVLYTLRVFGDEANKADIQATLEQILGDI